MNLDNAIQSSLKKNAMESAMQGVMANMGPKFEILATPKNAETVQQTVGKQVAVMDNSSLPRAVSSKEASSVKPPVGNVNPFNAPKGMENMKQGVLKSVNPMFRRTF